MKKIIEGILYDTSNSTFIARCSSCSNYHCPSYIEEDLYKTPDGNYFLCGYGNGGTAYNGKCDIVDMSGDACLWWFLEGKDCFDKESKEKLLVELFDCKKVA